MNAKDDISPTSFPPVEFPLPDPADIPEDIREYLAQQTEKAGFTPNVFIALARRPAEFWAFVNYYDALMTKETGNLTKADRELIVTATSAANGCLYCVVSHGAFLRIYARDKHIADKVAVNPRHAGLAPRQQAIVDLAVKLARSPELVRQADYVPVLRQGLDAEDIWDIAAVTGFFGLSNRMAIVGGIQPNPEFYVMGRVPKDQMMDLA
ncbi:peroxidase-related enzyme [Brevibacterium sp. 91QC2O2]|uniref:peroxidase-related enzyme n=1 Tax=Brevibacterium sp. 91QC2O2 TaxID=2968458 RepID=UPI00211BB1C2|nr:peroxidase-related enzyme [Brevibacterium sp. 91QC2O2]MCQ9367897.1 peroxidase-related enzyme [Brevibacterium sp. 91QC2O2]